MPSSRVRPSLLPCPLCGCRLTEYLTNQQCFGVSGHRAQSIPRCKLCSVYSLHIRAGSSHATECLADLHGVYFKDFGSDQTGSLLTRIKSQLLAAPKKKLLNPSPVPWLDKENLNCDVQEPVGCRAPQDEPRGDPTPMSPITCEFPTLLLGASVSRLLPKDSA